MTYLLIIGILITIIFFLIRELRYKIRTQNLFDELLDFQDDMYNFAENLTEKTEELIEDLYQDNQEFKEELYKILEDEDIDSDKLDKLYNRENEKPNFDTDSILEKISKVGFDNLTVEEKDFLKKGKNERRN